MKVFKDGQGATINVVTTPGKTHRSGTSGKTPPMSTQYCPNCGRPHDTRHRESCPAFGKACRKCGKRNHFAAKCRRQRTSSKAHTVDRSQGQEDSEDGGETLTLQLPVHCLDDSQFVTPCENREFHSFPGGYRCPVQHPATGHVQGGHQ